MKSIRVSSLDINAVDEAIEMLEHNCDGAEGKSLIQLKSCIKKLNKITKKFYEAKTLKKTKATNWKLIDSEESHYECENCNYNFGISNSEDLKENNINFCPCCGYEIEKIIL